MNPKVFLSYSWTSQAHQERVIEWAERLLADGVDVVLDVYDLKEGHDKYAFMERMVADPEITHVLVISDKEYASKADARCKGVGTESQIISKEVYEKTDQSKFIPIACEFADEDTPCLPTFLKARIWINFSSPEAVNQNWERLLRLLFGKPLHEKPTLGKTPAYITDDTSRPASPAHGKYSTLRQAILQGKKGVALYRRDFIDTCIQYADQLRVRERPDTSMLAERIVEDCGRLLPIRDHIIDWVLLESQMAPSEEFVESLLEVLERLRELKSRPAEINQWNDAWFGAHALFVYETFLYTVAALLKSEAYGELHTILTAHYLLPSTERHGGEQFERFDGFLAQSDILNSVLAPDGQRLYSPAAELLKRQANREDLPFADIIQADLLVLLMAFLIPGTFWYPQTLHYSSYGKEFPFFLRAAQGRHFKKLATITGVGSADALRQAVKEGLEKREVAHWPGIGLRGNFLTLMNLDKLDTLK